MLDIKLLVKENNKNWCIEDKKKPKKRREKKGKEGWNYPKKLGSVVGQTDINNCWVSILN